MLRTSFNSFFKHPISQFFKHVIADTKFFLQSVISIFTLKDFKEDQNNHVLERSLQTFELIVKIIVLNVALNEVFRGNHTDLMHDFLIEICFLIVFYALFLLHYYVSNGFELLLKSPYLMEIGSRIWTVYVLVFIVFLQFTSINNLHLSESLQSRDQGILASEFFLFLLIHCLYVFIVLVRRQIINKRSSLYFGFLMGFILVSFILLSAVETVLIQLHFITH